MSSGRQRSSIFNGLLLILLGVLFLLARFVPNLNIGHMLWRFWPAVIILWGVAKLVDHLGAQHGGQIRPPLLSGSEAALLVLVFLVLGGMGAYYKIKEKAPEFNINIDFFNHKASQSIELPAKTIPANSHVTLTTLHGDITAHAGDGNDLRVSVNETAEGVTEAAARERMKNLNVVIEQTSDGYNVHTVNEEGAGEHVTIDLDVTLPKNVLVSANSKHGDIQISGVAGTVTAATQHGDIEAHDLASDFNATLTKGDARVTEVAGNVSITGHGNEIEVSDVAGNIELNGDFFGPVRVRSVKGTTHYLSTKTDLTLVGLKGRMELDSGQIEISDVNGLAKLSTHNEDMEVENVAGRLDITDTHGGIKVRYSEVPREEINITNESGEVDVTLPSKSNFDISAISQSGEIQNEFDDSGLRLSNENGTGRLNGKVGPTGPKIKINTSYGTIYLRKSD